MRQNYCPFALPTLARPCCGRVFLSSLRFYLCQSSWYQCPQSPERLPLHDYIFEDGPGFDCDPRMLERYEPVLNIVDPDVSGAYIICFTSGYRRCRSAGGSLLKIKDRVRFFSPAEILSLLGFTRDYKIPDTVPIEAAYRLVGNSVDVRAINHLLGEVLQLT